MFGFPRNDMPLLSLYKSANHAERKNILTNAVTSINRLPAYLADSAQATKTHSDMFELFQLINYVSYTQRVETQQFFDISFDPRPLIAHFGANNLYFECNEFGKMRLKKPIVEIPNDVWREFRAAQQSPIEKIYQRLSSDLDVYNIFIPSKDAFPYGWYTSAEQDQDYDTAQGTLLALAREVDKSAQALTERRLEAFKQATKDLKKIGSDNYELQTLLRSINNEAVTLSRTEQLEPLVVAMTQTIAMLNGTLPIEEYEALLNSMHGHATSSPGMQELCKTLLTFCAVAVSIGIAALVIPTLGVVAAGVASTVTACVAGTSATFFAAGATYAFFADKDTEATGLSKAMADAANARKENGEPIRTTSPDYFVL